MARYLADAGCRRCRMRALYIKKMPAEDRRAKLCASHAEVEPNLPYGSTVYDMMQDERVQNQFADPAMLESIDFIRKAGNAAAHRGSLCMEDTVLTLEALHYLVGEFAVGVG